MNHLEYTKKIYYDCYVNTNLKLIIQHYDTGWIDPKYITENPNLVSGASNSYLQKDDYGKKLALDVLQNGMYWAYVVTPRNVICEGSHRIKGIKENYGTIWPKGKKVFYIKQSEEIETVRRYLNKNNEIEYLEDIEDKDVIEALNHIKLKKPVYMWVSDRKLHWKYLLNKTKNAISRLNTIIGKMYLIEIDNLASMLDCLIHMHIFLREDLFLYHNKNEMIPTFKCINNEKDFYNWKNSNFANVNCEEIIPFKGIDFSFSNDINNEKRIFINGELITNLIKIDIFDSEKKINIICKINSNLIYELNKKNKHQLNVYGRSFDIKFINHCLTAKFEKESFVQVISLQF